MTSKINKIQLAHLLVKMLNNSYQDTIWKLNNKNKNQPMAVIINKEASLRQPYPHRIHLNPHIRELYPVINNPAKLFAKLGKLSPNLNNINNLRYLTAKHVLEHGVN